MRSPQYGTFKFGYEYPGIAVKYTSDRGTEKIQHRWYTGIYTMRGETDYVQICALVSISLTGEIVNMEISKDSKKKGLRGDRKYVVKETLRYAMSRWFHPYPITCVCMRHERRRIELLRELGFMIDSSKENYIIYVFQKN